MTALASDNGNMGSECYPGAEHPHSALEEQGVSYILLVEDLRSTARVSLSLEVCMPNLGRRAMDNDRLRKPGRLAAPPYNPSGIEFVFRDEGE